MSFFDERVPLANFCQGLLTVLRFAGGFPVIWKEWSPGDVHLKSRVSVTYKLYSILLFVAFFCVYVVRTVDLLWSFSSSDCGRGCVPGVTLLIANCSWVVVMILLKWNSLVKVKLLQTQWNYVLKTKTREAVVEVSYAFIVFLNVLSFSAMMFSMVLDFIQTVSKEDILPAIFDLLQECDVQIFNFLMCHLLHTCMQNICCNIEYLINATAYSLHRSALETIPLGNSIISTNNGKSHENYKTLPSPSKKKLLKSLVPLLQKDIQRKGLNLKHLLESVRVELAEIHGVIAALQSFFAVPVLAVLVAIPVQDIALLLVMGGFNESIDGCKFWIVFFFLVLQLLQLCTFLNSQHRYENIVSWLGLLKNV